jgi:DNA-binding NarL/FixJ family response regulator
MMIKVAIVEDDFRWRQNLELLLTETEGLECVGSYGSGEDAVRELPARKPQVVLMDINLPGISGVECTRQLRTLLPEIQIVMLTVYDDSDRIFQALQMGANGYLLKRAPADEILQAVQDVHRGGAPMSAYIARKVVQSFQRQMPSAHPEEVLSRRESEVLGYVARGYSDKEVADALG